MANPNDLRRARAGEKDLHGADLTRADLSGADLTRADLSGADLTRADLSGADLEGVNLTFAKLDQADMSGAYLYRARINWANLSRTNLSGANLSGAELDGAKLLRADLSDADLSDAILSDAKLFKAILDRADLTRADLSNAMAPAASFRHATLISANLTDAAFTDADFTGANITNAILYGSDLTGAILTGAKGLSGKPVARGHGYGKASGGVLKLLAEGPQSARDFKRKYPAEFERLKPLTGGRDFTRETIDAVVAKTRGARWIVTRSTYPSAAQRHCPTANEVLLFNIDLDAERLTDRQRDLLRKLSEVSRRSGHPHERGDKLFTVGWVRYCDWSRPGAPSAKTWLVEEVQSDVQAARFGLKDDRAREQLAQGGIGPEEFEGAVAALAPWTDRFYEDAMGVTFALAKQRGLAVEMLTYDSKRGFGSPQAVYADLPRSMGMTRRPESAVLPSHAAWHYRPNGARASRRRPAAPAPGRPAPKRRKR